jgi:hypothetical protein
VEKKQSPGNHTDIAALAAAVVAVTVSLFLDEGLYGLISLIVSLVLIVIILAFVWPNKRSLLQSVALAAALGLASIPGIGFLIEAYHAPARMGFLLYADPLDGQDCVSRSVYKKMAKAQQAKNYSCNYKYELDSKVEPWTAGVGWLLVLLAALLVDLSPRRKRRK